MYSFEIYTSGPAVDGIIWLLVAITLMAGHALGGLVIAAVSGVREQKRNKRVTLEFFTGEKSAVKK